MRASSAFLATVASLGAAPIAAQQPSAADIERFAAQQEDSALALFRAYLRLPNDAHYRDQIRRMIDWVTAAFQERGFATQELTTEGAPLLLAEWRYPGDARTALVYLQADGQPVDPKAWNQANPYEPVLKERGPDGVWREIPWERLRGSRDPEWRIFARSASDSKGPNVQFLAALDAMHVAGVTPRVNLKVIVDFEEEMGSPNLPPAVRRHRDALQADMMVIFDGPPHISGRPTLKFGARGIATLTLVTYGPRVPVHSGHYGNYAPNPVQRLAEILAAMKDEHGRVTIPAFYDGVELDEETERILAAVPDDEAAIQRQLGLGAIDSVGGTLQKAVQYPSLNVRGIAAGWIGRESRTIVPDTATAEVDVRLVKESDAERLVGLIRSRVMSLGFHVLDRAPSDEERLTHPKIVKFTYDVAYPAFRTAFDSEPGRWLARALTRLHGTEPIRIRTSGGSIPIAPFVNTLGIPAVSVPTVNPDNNQHSPNENIRLGSFLEGIRVVVAVLAEAP